jgi:hypothetical protein
VVFSQRGAVVASHATVLGELLSLPLVVVLASFFSQPQILLYATAEDKLILEIFRAVDTRGGLFGGTAISGAGCVMIALLMPFSYLDEVISAGILIGINMTNAALLLTRCVHTPVSVSGRHSEANSTLNNDTHSLYCIPIPCILNHDTKLFVWGCISCSVRCYSTTAEYEGK